jgi:hypothetical protein
VKAEGQHKLTNPEMLENEKPVDFEIDEGVKQTPSGHLLISNTFKPVLSCEEQEVVAAKIFETSLEVAEQKDKDLRKSSATPDKKAASLSPEERARYFNYSSFPDVFITIQDCVDTYNRLGLPNRL